MSKAVFIQFILLFVVFFGLNSAASGQHNEEDSEFREFLKKHINIEKSESNPILTYSKSDSIIERINQDQVDKRLADERFTYQSMNNKKLLEIIEKENNLKGIELNAQERIDQLLVLLVIISFLGVIGLIISNNQKRKVNSKLSETNDLIEKQNLEIKKQQNALRTAKSDLENKVNEMERLTEEKTHLLSIVAHDMRTPLNSILGLCDLIELKENEDDAAKSRKQYLDLMKESGNRMVGMINTLLNVRKIETQNLEVNFEDVCVVSTIDKILVDFDNWIKRKGMKISVFDIEITQTVYVDVNLFRHLFLT